MYTAATSDGSAIELPDRIVVSPRTGVFVPLNPSPGSSVRSGQVIGHVRCGHEILQVTSPFDGIARDGLAWHNERVREYQPLLWMTANTT